MKFVDEIYEFDEMHALNRACVFVRVLSISSILWE